jgi:hypothetical protein
MLAKLNNGDRWQYTHQEDEYHRLVNILFFDNESLELLRLYPFSLTFDYTYKTNRFKLSLLNIVGHTAQNHIFTAG